MTAAQQYNVVRSLPFHRYIRAARVRKGLTQRVVADYIGIKDTHLIDIEKGRRPLRGDGKLRLLAEVLTVPLEVLEEKKGFTPWGREPWFKLEVDDRLRASVRFLPAAREAFRRFEDSARTFIDRSPIAEKDKASFRRALEDLAMVVGDGEESK